MNWYLMFIALAIFSAASISFLLFKVKQLQSRPDSYEVSELLNDLLSGRALIEVKRIAPSDFFIKSNRR